MIELPCACSAVSTVQLNDSDILLVRTERTLPESQYHEVRDNIEADLRHAGMNNPHVVVWPPHLDISILKLNGQEA